MDVLLLLGFLAYLYVRIKANKKPREMWYKDYLDWEDKPGFKMPDYKKFTEKKKGFIGRKNITCKYFLHII